MARNKRCQVPSRLRRKSSNYSVGQSPRLPAGKVPALRLLNFRLAVLGYDRDKLDINLPSLGDGSRLDPRFQRTSGDAVAMVVSRG